MPTGSIPAAEGLGEGPCARCASGSTRRRGDPEANPIEPASARSDSKRIKFIEGIGYPKTERFIWCLRSGAGAGAGRRVSRSTWIDIWKRFKSESAQENASEAHSGQPELQPNKGSSQGEACLRSMRDNAPSPCSPQGRESVQQRSEEFADFVRHMPSSFALAELYGDQVTAEALLALFQAESEARSVLYSLESMESVWRSLGQETKDRIRLGFESGRFLKTYESPLIVKGKNRVGRLRVYGNAIVAPVAAEFVRAYMEINR